MCEVGVPYLFALSLGSDTAVSVGHEVTQQGYVPQAPLKPSLIM